jgi:hypothetical protein
MRTRHEKRALRILGVLGALVLGLPLQVRADSQGLRVKGHALLDVHAVRDRLDTEIEGTLTDDSGHPLAGEIVAVQIAPADPTAESNAPSAGRCSIRAAQPARSTLLPRLGTGGIMEATTAGNGGFCFRARLLPVLHRAHVSFHGTPLLDGVDRELVVDPSKAALVLRFTPPPHIVQLDAASFTFDATATHEGDGVAAGAADVTVLLRDERERTLARGATDARGFVQFVVQRGALGTVGPGTLTLVFEGDALRNPTQTSIDIEKHARVSLRVRNPQVVVTADAAKDATVDVEVTSNGSALLSEGAVEAIEEGAGEVLGIAFLNSGAARVPIALSSHAFAGAQPGIKIPVQLSYIPSNPWYEAPENAGITVTLRDRSSSSFTVLLAAGVLVALLFVAGRTKSKRVADTPTSRRAPTSTTIRRIPTGVKALSTGWHGRVIDAHDGSPIAHARVWIESPTFNEQRIVRHTLSNADGSFHLDALGPSFGSERLAADAPLHTCLVQPLPAHGEIEICLLTRRRAVLNRLATWARQRGAPFDGQPEATPGHVKSVAGAASSTATWAVLVERTAFGRDDVDERAEAEVERLAPRASGGRETENATNPMTAVDVPRDRSI